MNLCMMNSIVPPLIRRGGRSETSTIRTERNVMVPHNVTRVWVVFIAVVFTLLGFTSPALALNGHPVEGEHYRIVRGSNPGSTYLKVTPGVNINTPLLAEALHTAPHDIRADNPTKTLALCHVQGDGYRMGSGINSPERRASNSVWQSCPDVKEQYVYIIPGETIEITGLKRLSFNEEQKVITELKACTDQACVLDKAKVLGAKVSGEAPAAPAAASPAPPVAPPSDGVSPPAPAATSEESFPPANPNQVENPDILSAELSAEKRNKSILVGLFLVAVVGLVLMQLRNRTLSRMNRFYLQDKQTLSRELESLRREPTKLRMDFGRERREIEEKVVAKVKELKASIETKDQEIVAQRQSADTLRVLLNAKEVETRQFRPHGGDAGDPGVRGSARRRSPRCGAPPRADRGRSGSRNPGPSVRPHQDARVRGTAHRRLE